MLITPYVSIDTLIISGVLIYALHKYLSRNFHFWEKKKVFYFEPSPFIGNFADIALFRTTIGEFLSKLYNQTKEPFFGIYAFDKPILVVRSPDLVKAILIRDFNNFDNRSISDAPHNELTDSMLFMSKNPEWKTTRVKMTPVFTSGKLKTMFPSINDIGKELAHYIEKQIPHFSLEAKEVCSKFSTDVISICAFGINAHCLDKEDAEFRKIGRMIFDFNLWNAVQQSSFFFLPQLVKLFRFNIFPLEVCDFLRNALWSTIEKREASGTRQNDMIDAIIDLTKNEQFKKEVNFTGDKVVAQAAQFFTAGFETTSSTMAFTLYELCIHPHIQNKLREEIVKSHKENDGFTFESVQNMKYLNMCVCETLRKYPVLPFLDRRCRNDYKMPGSEVIIEKDTAVFIPMFGLHYDEEYFPHPHKFNPERFSEENIAHIPQFTYIPFGDGPRNCIGERFGLLGTKLGLVHILLNFEVVTSSDTPIPIRFEPRSFVLASKVGLPMKFRKIITKAA